MIFRKAVIGDIDAIADIYSDTHTLEESGKTKIGWCARFTQHVKPPLRH